ncbi:MAG TPA: HAD-IIIA family hydrolase [Polyangia bacterium]|jgi:D-glycero-D-manno-heptose 1,7-bisphosphate phosphatase
MTPRLYIFDADGTLRRTRIAGQPCPHAPDEWELLPGVRPRLAALPIEVGFGIASNQDHVGYGLLSYQLAHGLLCDLLLAATGRPPLEGAVQLCPHRLELACACRKPAPELLLRILAAHHLPPEAALYVGDADCDAEAARRARIPFRWAEQFFGR